MRFFLVGGAVRDQLLGRAVKDHDWVVVGGTPEEMLVKGFAQVGADFPVFLHPDTKEEYALARQERKTGPGYHGFETRFDVDVTIEEDLFRRDLTINAMARDENDVLVDPYGGQEDLKNGVLRHVSEAFAEDPVRVLRVARFAARYDFEVHESTLQLMTDLVNAGELDHLTSERVWSELEKALGEDYPARFFWVLEACGAMDVLFPELDRNIIWVGKALERATLLEVPVVERFMVLFSLIDKNSLEVLCERLRAPSDVRNLSRKFNRFLEALESMGFEAEELLALMKELDMFRHPEHLFRMVRVLALSTDNEDVFRFLAAFRDARRVTFAMLSYRQQQMLRGSDIGKAIDGLRLKAIRDPVSV